MSAVISPLVFITMGSTVSPAAAMFGSCSICAIWTRQAWQPAPSLKYSSTFLPRRAARLTCVPDVVVRVKSGATLVVAEDTWRDVSAIAATTAITTTVAATDASRIRSRLRRPCSTWAARSVLMCSWLVRVVPCPAVPVAIGGSLLVGRGLFDDVRTAGRGVLVFGVVRQRRQLSWARAVAKRGVDEYCGQRQDEQPEDGPWDRRGGLLQPAEARGHTFAEGHLERWTGGHLPGAGQIHHEEPHDGERCRDHQVDRVGRQDVAAQVEPDRARLEELALA